MSKNGVRSVYSFSTLATVSLKETSVHTQISHTIVFL